jgi:hypothetical protein
VFGRTKQAPAPVVERPEKASGKNRPTPRRASAQAANRRPLVASDRRGATAASRTVSRDDRRRAQEGRLAGEERYLPLRDRGPVKRYVRDVVDARRNLGEWLLIFILVVFVLQTVLSRSTSTLLVAELSYAVLWVGLLAVVVDCLVLRRAVRRGVAERFGEQEVVRGVVSYAVMRAIQLRRARIPRPAVARGAAPRR